MENKTLLDEDDSSSFIKDISANNWQHDAVFGNQITEIAKEFKFETQDDTISFDQAIFAYNHGTDITIEMDHETINECFIVKVKILSGDGNTDNMLRIVKIIETEYERFKHE